MAGFLAKVIQYLKVTKRGATVPVVKGEIHAGEVIQAEMFLPSGDDSPPLPDDAVFFAKDAATGGYVCLGTIDQANAPVAEPGEKRLYSRDTNGNVKAVIIFKGDGVLEINGNADYAVAFDDLQTKLTALENQLKAHVHPGVTSGPSSTSASVTAFDIDISSAKVATVKLP